MRPRGRPFKKKHPLERQKELKKRTSAVSMMYSAVEKATAVGGNAGGGPIYGESTKGSFQGIVDVLEKKCHLSKKDTVIDVGSGRGKPNLHFSPIVKTSIGIECEELRTNLGCVSLKRAMELDTNISNCILQDGNISSAYSLDPCTVVYQFDVGVSFMVKC